MSLSLDAIFRPFNEFFVNKFSSGGGCAVKFRFAHVPQTVFDSDFLVVGHLDWGPYEPLARELFSTVVDGVTMLDTNGQQVWVGPRLISELYRDEILGPALPFVPAGVTDAASKTALVDTFNKVKADALRAFAPGGSGESASLQNGLTTQSSPSIPTPQMWWNKNDPSMWTSQSFQITGAVTPPGQPPPPSAGILQLKIDEVRMRTILESHLQVVPSAVAPPEVAPPQPTPVLVRPGSVMSRSTLLVARPMFRSILGADVAATHPVAATTPAIDPARSVVLHTSLIEKTSMLPFNRRNEIESMIAHYTPTQTVVTNNVTISFDFCVVNVARTWLHNALLDSRSWFVPGQPKGRLSANDGHGLPVLPVGFVAVKSLRIQAPWTPEDISNLEQSVQFGPFNFDSRVVDGAITHDGIQIVGWMLQDLPDLPPNASP